MTVTGFFTLELSCDAFTVGSLASVKSCDVRESFIEGTRMEAREVARRDGWLIAARNTRCLCPHHAAEKRAKWRSS